MTRSAGMALLCLTLASCSKHTTPASLVPGGNADRGMVAIKAYGCGSCHTIPGIRGARGQVGPALDGTAARMFIAGSLPNDPENIVRWILNPPAIAPSTAMPALGVSERDARDMAEYIYTIGRQ